MSKSHTAAGLVLWAMNVFPYVTVLTTAPTWRQVDHILWRYVRAQYKSAKMQLVGELKPKAPEYTFGEDRIALGLSTNEPERFQGFHAKRVFVVVDEASGVDEMIWDAVKGCVTSEHDVVLAIGNPTSSEGNFADYLTRRKPATVVNVSSWEAAEAREADLERLSGLASKRWCQDRLDEWGSDSSAYQSRVLGLVPTESDDTLIKLAWVEAAFQRDATCDKADPTIIGLDVARYGDDKTVWAVRRGDDVIAYESLDKGSLVQQFELTRQYVAEYGAQTIVIDDTGVGGGLTDMLVSAKFDVVPVNFGDAADDERFENRRAEIWWNVRERLRQNQGHILEHDDVRGDLVAPRYSFTKKFNRIIIESKKDIKARRKRSTDFGDAVALALWGGRVVDPFSVNTGEREDFWDQSWSKRSRKGVTDPEPARAPDIEDREGDGAWDLV